MYIRIRGAKKESWYLEAPLFVEIEVRKGKEGLGKGIQQGQIYLGIGVAKKLDVENFQKFEN